MDVAVLAGLYGGIPARVVARAKEYLRVTATKRSASMGMDITAPVACLLVAGKSVQKILHAVDIKSVVQTTPAALCIRFGCEAFTELVNRIYNEYQVVAKRLARGRAGAQASPMFDSNEPIFAAACLYACSKSANLRISRNKLLDAVCGNPKSFDAIVSSIESHCKASLNGAVVIKKKRSATSLQSEQQDAAIVADINDNQEKKSKEMNHTPTRSQSDVLRRLHENIQEAATIRKTRKVSAMKAATLASDKEYAAWRATALAYMQNKRHRECDDANDKPV